MALQAVLFVFRFSSRCLLRCIYAIQNGLVLHGKSRRHHGNREDAEKEKQRRTYRHNTGEGEPPASSYVKSAFRVNDEITPLGGTNPQSKRLILTSTLELLEILLYLAAPEK